MEPTQQPTDQQALTLTHAIALQESGENGKPNYNAVGDAGTSKGAYQWQPGNFEAAAKNAGLDPKDFSPENQDKVAYSEVKAYKDKGYDPGQIASLWNSGSPNNWQNHSGTTTINGKTISYDTPAYVKGVQKYYQQLAGSQGAPTANSLLQGAPQANQSSATSNLMQPSADSSQLDSQIQGFTDGSATANSKPGFLQGLEEDAAGTNPESIGTQLGNTAKGVGNFLLPSVGDAYHDVTGTNTKTGLQQLGDLGTSALGVASILPGTDAIADPLEAARGADAAVEGSGALGKALASNTAKNAALGAGYGVSGAVGDGDTNLKSIGENAALGAAGGGLLGKAGDAIGGALTKKATEGAGGRLEQLNSKLTTVGNAFDKNSTSTTNPIKTLVDNGLTKDLKVVDGKVNIDGLTNTERTGSIDNLIDQHSSQASDLVKTLKGGVPLEEFKNELIIAAEKNPDIVNAGKVDSAEADINRRMASYKRSFGDTIPYTAIDGIRTAMNKVWSPDEVDVARSIGDTARSYLYNGDGTNDAIKSAMANETELIKARNYVEKLKNRNVKGGQLQKYLADAIGAGAGGAVGKIFGPVGEGIGGVAGGLITDMLIKHSQDRYFDPLLSKATKSVSNSSKNGAIRVAGKIAKGGALRALTNN